MSLRDRMQNQHSDRRSKLLEQFGVLAKPIPVSELDLRQSAFFLFLKTRQPRTGFSRSSASKNPRSWWSSGRKESARPIC